MKRCDGINVQIESIRSERTILFWQMKQSQFGSVKCHVWLQPISVLLVEYGVKMLEKVGVSVFKICPISIGIKWRLLWGECVLIETLGDFFRWSTKSKCCVNQCSISLGIQTSMLPGPRCAQAKSFVRRISSLIWADFVFLLLMLCFDRCSLYCW